MKLIYLKTVENVCSFGNWSLEVMSTLPSDSMKRILLQGQNLMVDSSKWQRRCPVHFAVVIFDFLRGFHTQNSVLCFWINQATSSLIEDDSNYGCRLMLFDQKWIDREIYQTRCISINVVDFLMTCVVDCFALRCKFNSAILLLQFRKFLIVLSYFFWIKRINECPLWLKIHPKSWSMGSGYDYDS